MRECDVLCLSVVAVQAWGVQIMGSSGRQVLAASDCWHTRFWTMCLSFRKYVCCRDTL